jgi:flagellar basal body-associated protein FliL
VGELKVIRADGTVDPDPFRAGRETNLWVLLVVGLALATIAFILIMWWASGHPGRNARQDAKIAELQREVIVLQQRVDALTLRLDNTP